MEGQFPAGLRVLVVDDDMTCLKVLDRMLRKCCYNVTTCNQATVALNLLRARKGCFDVVLSDVHMPDMDGYKLLEQVGLEMDLPVIMMSADQRTSAVMKGIKHGACDYLIKPIREEELKIIWQHVFRKQCSGTREAQTSEDSDHHRKGSYDADNASSINEGTEGMFKIQRKKRDAKEDDDAELENDDPSNSKRPRVVWSVELHQQFVSAVNQLGIDKAVPKRILELMSVPGLTRENVASHLQGCSGPVRTNANVKLLKDIGGLNNNLEDTMSRQESLLKFRLYLKRLSGVAQQGGNSLCGLMDPAVQIGASGGRFDVQALAASGQISPHTLAALHNELYGQPTGSIMLSTMDQQALLQASLQGSNGIPVEHGLSLRQPPMKSQPNISKHYPQSVLPEEGVSSVFGSWSTNSLSAVGHNGNAVTSSAQNVNIVKDIVQQKCMSLDSSRTINVQPSCLVIPSGSSVSFQAENGPASIDQKNGYHRSIVNTISSQPNMPSPVSGLNPFPTGILTGYSGHRETSSSSRQSDGFSRQLADSTMNFGASRQLQGMAPNMCNIQRPYDTVSFEKMDQQLLKTISCDGNGSSTLSRFAVDEFGSSTSNFNHGKTCGDTNGIGNKVKQEQNMDFVDNAKLGVPMFLNFSTNDIMRVFYE